MMWTGSFVEVQDNNMQEEYKSRGIPSSQANAELLGDVYRRKMLTEGADNISVRVQRVWRRHRPRGVAVCDGLAGQ